MVGVGGGESGLQAATNEMIQRQIREVNEVGKGLG
jgi:hypothetical protein